MVAIFPGLKFVYHLGLTLGFLICDRDLSQPWADLWVLVASVFFVGDSAGDLSRTKTRVWDKWSLSRFRLDTPFSSIQYNN